MYYGIIHAIPVHWRQGLINEVFDPDHGLGFESILNVPNMSRVIYQQIISTVYTVPTSCSKWNLSFPDIAESWNIIFRIPFTSVRESKIQYFQYRFLHRALGTNSLCHRMNLIENPSCTFCGNQNETLDHLFWECGITSNFILDVEQRFLGRQFVFTKQDIFFGYTLLLKHPYNFLIFYMKYYIFEKKINKGNPLIDEFLNKFKFHFRVEKYISEQKSSRKGLNMNEFKEAFSELPFLFN